MLFAAIAATSLARKRLFAFRDTAVTEATADTVLPESCFGMPTLSRADRKVAAAERIPPALFYLPLVFNWMRLGLRHRSLTLPTAANPNIFTGGMWGDRRVRIFSTDAGRAWSPISCAGRAAGVRSSATPRARALEDAGPISADRKPDIGWHGMACIDIAPAENYIANFPLSTLIVTLCR
jgi:hypothetical protein